MVSRVLIRIFAAKTGRVFASGMLSVITPVYLDLLGYPPIYIGVFVLVMVASGVFSNVMLSRFESRFGRRFFILLFSGLMAISGLLLSLTTSTDLLLLAFFIGNISTTGTEAGPFQAIEAGVLPGLGPPERTNRLFGVYNGLGYGAASIGALGASIPGYLQNSLQAFRVLYLVYSLIGLALLVLYFGLREIESPEEGAGKQVGELSAKAKEEITRISALYSVDAFGGSLATQSLLAYWFYLTYHVALADLGMIFFVVNVAAAVSIYAASLIAERLGNLRTMASTHLLSSVFLTAIPLAGSLTLALLLLILRQSLSQMDVPTRQAFMAELFDYKDLVKANAATNTFRSVGGLFGGPMSGVLYSVGLMSLPILSAGVSKILYDLAIYSSYRKRAK